MSKQHYLSFDLGTATIGYALTDEDYSIVNCGKKKALGVLTFTPAVPAEERRMYRTARRRLIRRKRRVQLLQRIFEQELIKSDANFLPRLNENDLHLEHRDTAGKYSLFNDTDYNDVKHYQLYPTIYHLRQHLCNNDTDDIRLLYLACHHIVKYRGHFLQQGDGDDNTEDYKQLFAQLNDCIQLRNMDIVEMLADNADSKLKTLPTLDLQNLDSIEELLCQRGTAYDALVDSVKTSGRRYIGRADVVNKVVDILGGKCKNIVSIIWGGKVNLAALFGKENYEQPKGFFLSDELDEQEDMALLRDNYNDIHIIELLKQLHDWRQLTSMLKGDSCLSSAMVNLYNKHQKDLKNLKNVIKQYSSNSYDKVFGELGDSSKKLNNYTHYIGGGRYLGVKMGNHGRIGSTCSNEDFGKFIKLVLKDITAQEAQPTILEIISDIDNGTYMPKIISKNNSTIPYQLNMQELNMILSRAENSGKFPFLKCGTPTNTNKIKSLLSFRVPYYVGPLKLYRPQDSNHNAWAVRTEGEITPWTYNDIVDEKKSNAQFILRMTNNCTYLPNAKTLPKNSLLYSKYMVLSELNNLRINGEAISISAKQMLIDQHYTQVKKPTINSIKKFLVANHLCAESPVISGCDTVLQGNLSSYHMYRSALGDIVDTHPDIVEQLIFLSTIHPDATMVEESIKEENKQWNLLTSHQIKAVKGIKFNGWGALSSQFLDGGNNNGLLLCDINGEPTQSIIDIMYNTNLSLQGILFAPQYSYQSCLDMYLDKTDYKTPNKVNYDLIKEMYVSPAVKKATWQCLLLAKDIIKNTKVIPDKIFIESTRTNSDEGKGNRKKSRHSMILAMYSEARALATTNHLSGDQVELINKLENRLNADNFDINSLKSEKLYLYYMQLGRCMYTGQTLDLTQLSDDNVCDVDHIIPQAVTKDDSLNNKVLVYKVANADKSDKYPVPQQYRQSTLWRTLHSMKLLTSDKYARLMRTADFTQIEKDGFINRQLVETSQITMCAKQILQQYFSQDLHRDVEIILSRAGNVSSFRKNFALTKSRDINAFHHAYDAYYNIVVGDILNKHYNHSWHRSGNNAGDRSANFDRTVTHAMTKDNCQLLHRVKQQCDTFDINFSFKAETGKGQLYKDTLFPATKNEKSSLIPRANAIDKHGAYNVRSDTTKYGGYKSSGTAYFVVVDHIVKKRQARSIIDISQLEHSNLKLGKTTYAQILQYKGLDQAQLANIPGLNNSQLLVGSLLKFNNYQLKLTGCKANSVLFHNANQLFVRDNASPLSQYTVNEYVKEMSVAIDKVLKNTRQAAKEEKDQAMVNELITLIERNQLRANNNKKASKIVVINASDNRALYDYYVTRLSSIPYRDIPTYRVGVDSLTKCRDSFVALDIYQQIIVLQEILHAMQCNAKVSDLHILSYSVDGKKKTASTEAFRIGQKKEITNTKVQLISYSKSALKQRIIDLTLMV